MKINCKLENPKTSLYFDFKNHILSGMFPWYWFESVDNPNTPKYDKEKYTNISFYSHGFLMRPQDNHMYPNPVSSSAEKVSFMIQQILEHNNIELNCFLRIGANCVHPQSNSKVVSSIPHVDHYFPHKNLIIYFTDAGGKTIVGDTSFDPEEDDVFLFEGEHYMQTPSEKRRIVLVSTFI